MSKKSPKRQRFIVETKLPEEIDATFVRLALVGMMIHPVEVYEVERKEAE